MALLRYAVLRHEAIDDPHFDLMFERSPGSPLMTWRSREWPIAIPLPVVRLADHRSAYLEYEGEVSGNRGFVRRVEGGEYELEEHDPGRLILAFPRRAPPARLVLTRVDLEQWTIGPFDRP